MTPNSISFIALAKEYCTAVANPPADLQEFVADMLRLLPRIYITASDLAVDSLDEGGYLDQAMDEDTYTDIMGRVSGMLGFDDSYLEVFMSDMKYSDTPIATTISEGLADIAQVLFNLLATVREAPEPVVEEALYAVKAEFAEYWSQTLCNVLRALNAVKYQS